VFPCRVEHTMTFILSHYLLSWGRIYPYIHPSYTPLTHSLTQSSNPQPSLNSAHRSRSGVLSSTVLQKSCAICSRFFAVDSIFFHSFAACSRSCAVTFLAWPAFRLSNRVAISAFSRSRAEMLESRSAVLRVLFREVRVLRRVLVRVCRSVVRVWREVIWLSRAASWSEEIASSGLWVNVSFRYVVWVR
jgi:hypothetical protein